MIKCNHVGWGRNSPSAFTFLQVCCISIHNGTTSTCNFYRRYSWMVSILGGFKMWAQCLQLAKINKYSCTKPIMCKCKGKTIPFSFEAEYSHWKSSGTLRVHKAVGLEPGGVAGGEALLPAVSAGCQHCCEGRGVWPSFSWGSCLQLSLTWSQTLKFPPGRWRVRSFVN